VFSDIVSDMKCTQGQMLTNSLMEKDYREFWDKMKRCRQSSESGRPQWYKKISEM